MTVAMTLRGKMLKKVMWKQNLEMCAGRGGVEAAHLIH